MKTLKFKTNVSCSGCVLKVTSILDELKSVTKWSVDTTNPSKILTVESEGTSSDEVIKAINSAGYKADLISAE